MKILSFTLAGPLAAYGESSRWDNRDTTDMPTKSAVIGLLGCCIGIERGSARLSELSKRLHMAVRRERTGRVMTDYHTVHGMGGKILTAERKPRCDTIVTCKQYLQDAAFQVFLYGDEALLEYCARAMKNPHWVISLGRRSCPPSIPVIPQLFEADSIEAALQNRVSMKTLRRTDAQKLCEVEHTSGDVLDDESYLRVRHDEVISADVNIYEDRITKVMRVKAGDGACT